MEDNIVKLILEAKPISEAGRKFLETLNCPIDIEIRMPCDEVKIYHIDPCPVCGSYHIIKEGRCTTCYECGWSKCSL